MPAAALDALALPRLRMRAELAAVSGWGEGGEGRGGDGAARGRPAPSLVLLKAVPELNHLFGFIAAAPPAKGGGSRPAAPGHPSRDGAPDAAETAAADLARVKKEEVALLSSLTAARSGAATSGAALQAADVARLREAAGARRAALDAVREECAALTVRCTRLRLDEADAGAGRGPPGTADARVAALRAKVAACEATLDSDATRQRMYTLLEERTRCEEMGRGVGGGEPRRAPRRAADPPPLPPI